MWREFFRAAIILILLNIQPPNRSEVKIKNKKKLAKLDNSYKFTITSRASASWHNEIAVLNGMFFWPAILSRTRESKFEARR